MLLDFSFGLSDLLAMLFDGCFDHFGIAFEDQFGFGPASGSGLEAVDAFLFVAVQPVVDRQLGEAQDLADLLGDLAACGKGCSC